MRIWSAAALLCALVWHGPALAASLSFGDGEAIHAAVGARVEVPVFLDAAPDELVGSVSLAIFVWASLTGPFPLLGFGVGPEAEFDGAFAVGILPPFCPPPPGLCRYGASFGGSWLGGRRGPSLQVAHATFTVPAAGVFDILVAHGAVSDPDGASLLRDSLEGVLVARVISVPEPAGALLTCVLAAFLVAIGGQRLRRSPKR